MANKFFEKGMKTGTLVGVGLKVNSENEKRIRLDFELPLDKSNLKGAPDSVQAAYDAVAELSKGMTEVKVATQFQGTTVEFFVTPDHTTPLLTILEANLQKLVVFRPTPAEGVTDKVFLFFTTTVPATTEIWDWAYENMRATVFAQFHKSQAKLPGMEEDADEPEAEAEAEAEKPARRRRGKEAAAGAD